MWGIVGYGEEKRVLSKPLWIYKQGVINIWFIMFHSQPQWVGLGVGSILRLRKPSAKRLPGPITILSFRSWCWQTWRKCGHEWCGRGKQSTSCCFFPFRNLCPLLPHVCNHNNSPLFESACVNLSLLQWKGPTKTPRSAGKERRRQGSLVSPLRPCGGVICTHLYCSN